MPEAPSDSRIYAKLIICEKVLAEQDQVLSAIRIADIFYYTLPDLPVPLPIEAQAIPIHFLASVRFDPPEYGEHALEIQLIRPNGEAKIIGNAIRSAAQKKFPEVRIPSGIDFRGAFGLIPRAVGTHYIALLLDGEEVARAPVTLIQRDAPKGVPEQPR